MIFRSIELNFLPIYRADIIEKKFTSIFFYFFFFEIFLLGDFFFYL